MKIHDGQRRIAGDPKAELHGLRQHDLLLRREERDAGDLAEVQTGRVLDVEEIVVLGDLGLVIGGRLRRDRRGDRLDERHGRVVFDDRGHVLGARSQLVESGRRAGTDVKLQFRGLIKESRQGRSRSVDARG